MRTEKDNTKVMIMGEEWDIKYSDKTKDFDDKEIGYTLDTRKLITVHSSLDFVDRYTDKEVMQNDTIIHELIHAYFAEVGLWRYCKDETLVGFLEKTMPKMFKTFKELDCLE